MPQCCVKGCKSRSSKKHPNISFHRLPKNTEWRAKWIRNIGRHNWKPPVNASICSLHFEKDCLNHTLNLPRVKENCIPTIFPQRIMPAKIEDDELSETECLAEQLFIAVDDSNFEASTSNEDPLELREEVPQVPRSTALNIKCDHTYASSSAKQVSTEMVQKMTNKIFSQRNVIKRLQEKVRRQSRRISNLNSVINTLRNKNNINDEASSLIKDSAEPKEGKMERQILNKNNLSSKQYTNTEVRVNYVVIADSLHI